MHQHEVASSLGVAQSLICGYEQGQRVPPLKMARQLAELYSLDTDIELRLYRSLTSTEAIATREAIAQLKPETPTSELEAWRAAAEAWRVAS